MPQSIHESVRYLPNVCVMTNAHQIGFKYVIPPNVCVRTNRHQIGCRETSGSAPHLNHSIKWLSDWFFKGNHPIYDNVLPDVCTADQDVCTIRGSHQGPTLKVHELFRPGQPQLNKMITGTGLYHKWTSHVHPRLSPKAWTSQKYSRPSPKAILCL